MLVMLVMLGRLGRLGRLETTKGSQVGCTSPMPRSVLQRGSAFRDSAGKAGPGSIAAWKLCLIGGKLC